MGLAVAAAGAAQAGLYKWTDSQGKTHYSDQPPSSDARNIGRPAAGQSAITRDAQQSLDEKNDAYHKRRKAEEEARTKAAADAEQARIKRESCDKARKNVDTLANTPRVYSTDASGRRVYMDDAARASAMASSRKAIDEHCN